jgi:hypothetical protein
MGDEGATVIDAEGGQSSAAVERQVLARQQLMKRCWLETHLGPGAPCTGSPDVRELATETILYVLASGRGG